MRNQQLQRSFIPNSSGHGPQDITGRNGVRGGLLNEDPESTLVDGLKLQVPEAYDLLVRAYEKRLQRLALKITMCTEDAEDVVQNTFLQVFRRVESFRGECKFGSWITAITINQAIIVLRRRKKTTVSLDTGVEGGGERRLFSQFTGCQCTPEQICLRLELEQSLIGFVAKLRKTRRSVFEMHVAQELSVDEIADRLGITVAATKSRLFRARRDIQSRAKRHSQASNPTPSASQSMGGIF